MKRLTTALLATTVLAFAAGPAYADKVKVGIEAAYPPFSAVSADGTFVGFDIDIANALCDEMGAECTLVQQDWDGIIPALLARKYDAIIASMSITEERKKKVAFTAKYYNTPAKFAQKKGAGITIDAAGLAGKTVGVQRATTHDNFITEVFGDDVEIKRYATQDEAYLDAVAGRLDLLLADSVAMADGFLATDQGMDWEFVGPGFSDPKYFGVGAGIAVRKDDTELRGKLDAALDAILRNGVYKAINDKYFDFNVYGEPLPQ
ncbi:MAG: ABC transporter substrate-binding protein [Chromatiales bacterium]|nr:ABC transporter substrate-binding protein [Chromatiales bacterium]